MMIFRSKFLSDVIFHGTRLIALALCVFLCFGRSLVWAETFSELDSTAQVEFLDRLDLARRVQVLNPVEEQVNRAIDRFVAAIPEDIRGRYRTVLRDMINYDALEKVSIDAYAETYTAKELRTMIEYAGRPVPADVLASMPDLKDKHQAYINIVYPAIIEMMDKAMMRLKTEGSL